MSKYSSELVLTQAKIFLYDPYDEEAVREMVRKIRRIDGIEKVTVAEFIIEINTRAGDGFNFWDENYPKIKRIMERSLDKYRKERMPAGEKQPVT